MVGADYFTLTFEAFRLDDILYIITCCLYIDYRHREQLLSLVL